MATRLDDQAKLEAKQKCAQKPLVRVEGHPKTKSGIVKIHLEFVTFLTTQHRHVRATTRNVERAEGRKMQEIRLMQELLDFIGNM